MQSSTNKELMQAVFAHLAEGDGKPFVAALADDVCWHLTGTTAWSRTYAGKDAVVNQLLKPLFAQFADQYTNCALRFIADQDYVVVECRGRVTTKTGKLYANTYCYVCRLADGMIRELTEYLDTQLVNDALAPPAK